MKRVKSPCAASSARSEIVRTAANGNAVVVADLGDRGTLHLDRERLGQGQLQRTAFAGGGDEAVAADHQPAMQRDAGQGRLPAAAASWADSRGSAAKRLRP